MQIMGLGLDTEGELLFRPTEQSVFARQIIDSWEKRPQGATIYRGEVKPVAMVEGDPLIVGWTFLIHNADPRRDQIIDILQQVGS